MKFQLKIHNIVAIFAFAFLLSACANKNPVSDEKRPEQDIPAKLEEADFDYSEFKPDYPAEAKYDFFIILQRSHCGLQRAPRSV